MNKSVRAMVKNSSKLGRSIEGVALHDVKFTSIPDAKILVATATAKGSQSSYGLELAVFGEKVRVHCDCDDFAYTFMKALSGENLQLREVTRPKPKGTGTPRAVDQTGICKHLMALIERTV